MSYAIRDAFEEDAETLSALGAETFTATFGHLYSKENLEKFLRKGHSVEVYCALARDPESGVWIAEDEAGRPVGYAVAGPCTLPVPDMPANSGELGRLYLLSEAKGTGLGAKLLEKALDFLRDRFEHIYLSVYRDNHVAQRLYQRYGFVKIHDYFYMVGDHADPEYIMELKLAQPVSAAPDPRLVICIGTQKAGTTWLSDYMRSRAEVHAPPVKEVHYFDARFVPKQCAKYEEEMLCAFQKDVAALTLSASADPAVQQKLAAMLLRFRMIADPREYMRFMNWGRRSASVLFEATPDYVMLDRDGFAATKRAHAVVRLIMLIRNPADRFWSSLTFNKTHRQEFDIDIMFDRLIDREDFRLLADYGRTIAEARAALGAERRHI